MSSFRNPFHRGSSSSSSKVSVAELHSRARQLENIKEYDIAEELYAEILKKDHQNELAKERLTALQRVKHGLPPQSVERGSIREVMPESMMRPNTTVARSDLPRISPGIKSGQPPFVEDRIPNDFNGTNTRSFSLNRLQDAGEVPEWVVGSEASSVSSSPGSHQVTSSEMMTDAELVANEAIRDRNMPDWATNENLSQSESQNSKVGLRNRQNHVAGQISSDSFVQGNHEQSLNQPYEVKTIADLQERLVVNPEDQAAISELIKRLPDANRDEMWQLSSSLEVLAQNEYSRVVILSKLSKSLASNEIELKMSALKVIAGLGATAKELAPLVRLRMNDESEQVRDQAARVITAIGA